ncbi:UDP-3-O-(3-hydroxymyristoyl)glucosamine N-acyltransferase [Siccirubricoccus sp. KC 17139]|uniref:UDP-3-O-acylglucosamine N-acyltransferase n=1 Tax=Siccirubricoccus soli TaxID=2899147 RepID=A0ABT1DAU9_9PROT|nr:UDP-3-O-(3-hydroxymyristoyl)glucosamine N-acyltransferase [Siccirubricoccus soli]MCO6419068.1 UDP-3-O-(3-hydroxymyristoyl)glucosamine N-acyltransferase [Siccirubricoccus soli]MCP2685203.1 UDP-3-O-(3-hydroxymyristoyl)glucosamine N-acyltransferase [Siccirubricoccus soli]
MAAIAAAAGGRCEGDGERLFIGVGPLQTAGPEEVSFLDNRRYLPQLRETRAGAVVMAQGLADQVPEGTVAIVVPAPYLGFARVAALFHPAPAATPGIHPTAVIGPGATVSPEAEIGPYAVIGAGAEIGPGCIIGPHAAIGAGCVLGPRCRIHAHASLSHAILGEGVVLHPGARVGQEGFGFAPTPDGRFETMPQLGRVILGDHVEIGANACVDRGSQGDTVLGAGTRLDNLVQIGHNVRTGRGCIVVGQAGISGSTVLGDYVQVAAQAGLTGHLQIGTQARIGAQAGVMNDVAAKSDVIGSPAMPVREFWRMTARMKRLGEKQGKTE